MDYLSYPPEILKNIIDDDFIVWRHLFFSSKKYNTILKDAIFAREPLRKKYREWYFLVYLKLTYNTNNDDKDIILKEIKKHIPVTIEPWIIISLVEFIIGDEYKYFFDYTTQMLEYNISSYQYKMVKWLANAFINHKDDYVVLRLIPQSRKDKLKFSLYKEIVTNICSNTI